MNGPGSILRSGPRPMKTAISVRHTHCFTYRDSGKPFPCPYCGKDFWSLGGQARHIAQTECWAKEAAKLATAALKRRLEQGFESDSQRSKRHIRFVQGDITAVVRVVVEAQTIAPETASPQGEQLNTEPPPQTPTPNDQTPPATPHPHLTTPDGGQTFIESFPNPLAGSPVNDYVAPPAPFNLHSYINSTGCLSNPEHFDTLDLLMTTGLTDKG